MSRLIELDASVPYYSYQIYIEYSSRLLAGEPCGIQDLAVACGRTYSEVEAALADLRKRGYLKQEESADE